MKPIKIILFFISLNVLALSKYSISMFERPFTMPQNSFQTGLSFSNKNIAQLGLTYGITDYFELGLAWGGFDVAQFPSQKIALNAGRYLFSTPYVSAMITFEMPLYFQRMLLQEASLGMPTFFPLIKGHLSLVLLEDLLKFNWLDDVYTDFTFKTKLSWQATKALYLTFSTIPGTLSTLGKHTHIVKTTPIQLGALYAVTPMMDVFANLGFDNIQTSNNFTATLGVNFRAGEIEG